MKASIFILFIISIVMGCKKSISEPMYQSQGSIIGIDMRACAMCGGLEITIKNDTTKNAPAVYLIGNDLPPLNMGANTKYPINVTLNWHHAPAPLGAYRVIIVSEIRVIK